MTAAELERLIDGAFDEVRELRATKGADYSRGEDDTLSNFKRAALALALSPTQVWAVYASKHWDAVMSFCRAGQVESEPVHGRILDLITYLLLLQGLIEDGDA